MLPSCPAACPASHAWAVWIFCRRAGRPKWPPSPGSNVHPCRLNHRLNWRGVIGTWPQANNTGDYMQQICCGAAPRRTGHGRRRAEFPTPPAFAAAGRRWRSGCRGPRRRSRHLPSTAPARGRGRGSSPTKSPSGAAASPPGDRRAGLSRAPPAPHPPKGALGRLTHAPALRR